MDLSTVYIALTDGQQHLTIDGHLVLLDRLLVVFNRSAQAAGSSAAVSPEIESCRDRNPPEIKSDPQK